MTDENSFEERLLDVEEEELILVVNRGYNPKQRAPILSVLDSYDQDSKIVYLTSPTLYLQPAATINDAIRATVRNIGRKGYRTKSIHELCLGKSEVVEYCRRNNLDIHADWIEDLEQPYRMPVVSSIQWVSPENPPRLRKSDKEIK